MARVWRAHDTVSDSPVALKVLFEHLRSDPMIVERFRREIAAVRRIEHPAIVPIYELIENDEILCLVQEYHPGRNLKRWIRRRQALDVQTVIEVAVQVLGALGEAHQNGVIHRDIKPQNILVSDDLTTRVIDFGLARVDDLVGLTTHTMSVGTPEYMAPELMVSQVVDGRADIYSLGITMFEALSGQLPYTASTPIALMKMHHEDTVPRVDALVEDVPGFLVDAIGRAMQTNPEDRFSVADEMIRALKGEEVPSLEPVDANACTQCGSALVPGMTTCLECGLERVEISESPSSQGAVALLGRGVGSWRKGVRYLTYEPLTYADKARLIETLEGFGGETNFTVKELDGILNESPLMVGTHLSEHDVRTLAEKLHAAGFYAKSFGGGLGSRFRRFLFFQEPGLWMVRGLVAAVVGPIFVLIWSLIFTSHSWLSTWAPVALVVLFMLVWWYGRYTMRTNPITRFPGFEGFALAEDGLNRRAVETFKQVKSPRIRKLMRRVLSRGIAFRARLDEVDWAPPTMLSDIDDVLMRALSIGREVGVLDDRSSDFDPRAIMERLAGLDERIEEADTHRAAELIKEKVALQQLMRANDVRQDEIARLSAILLNMCSELEAMELEFDALNSDTLEPVSMILESLKVDVEAVVEVSESIKA